MENVFSAIVSALVALGGWEAVKYFLHRKTNKRNAETESDALEFNVLRDTVTFLQNQLQEKEQRFAEQTELVRKLTSENLELTKTSTMQQMQLEMKNCNVRNCAKREPQTGF